MSELSKENLKESFLTGTKLTQSKMNNLVDSVMHKTEDQDIVKSAVGLASGQSAASTESLLSRQILQEPTLAFYTDGSVQSNYNANASGISGTNLKALWGGRTATTIGNGAFINCANLTSVDFHMATTIGDGSFYQCSNLTSVDFPLATTIGSVAFSYCTSLTSVDFPLVTTILNSSFSYCTNLTSVDFPLTTSIGNSAFTFCTNLTSVNFPLVTTIVDGAFSNCFNLTSVDFPLVTSIGNGAFFNSTNLASVDFSIATLIGSNAFQSCTNLTLVDFPLVTSIGSSAFAFCYNLTSLYLNAPLSGLNASALFNSFITTIHLRPAPNTPAGWTEGSGQTIAGKNGITVVFDWTTYPYLP